MPIYEKESDRSAMMLNCFRYISTCPKTTINAANHLKKFKKLDLPGVIVWIHIEVINAKKSIKIFCYFGKISNY